jgi:hypothetical protein
VAAFSPAGIAFGDFNISATQSTQAQSTQAPTAQQVQTRQSTQAPTAQQVQTRPAVQAQTRQSTQAPTAQQVQAQQVQAQQVQAQQVQAQVQTETPTAAAVVNIDTSNLNNLSFTNGLKPFFNAGPNALLRIWGARDKNAPTAAADNPDGYSYLAKFFTTNEGFDNPSNKTKILIIFTITAIVIILLLFIHLTWMPNLPIFILIPLVFAIGVVITAKEHSLYFPPPTPTTIATTRRELMPYAGGDMYTEDNSYKWSNWNWNFILPTYAAAPTTAPTTAPLLTTAAAPTTAASFPIVAN